jgi:NitT/TauT family transport system substrate-binding protein
MRSIKYVAGSIKYVCTGVADGAKLEVAAIQNQLVFSREVGTNFGKDFDAAASQNDLWTNIYVERAAKK